jgi:hypothetical protein
MVPFNGVAPFLDSLFHKAMEVEVRILSLEDALLEDDSLVTVTVSLHHGLSLDSSPGASKQSISSPNSAKPSTLRRVTWNEAFLFAGAPNEIEFGSLKVTAWETVKGQSRRACVGFAKCTLREISEAGSQVAIQLHPKANKTGPASKCCRGRILCAVECRSLSGLENTLQHVAPVAERTSTDSSFLPLLILRGTLRLVDLFSWRNRPVTALLMVLTCIAIRWNLIDICIVLLGLSTAVLTGDSAPALRCAEELPTAHGRQVKVEFSSKWFRLFPPHCTVLNTFVRCVAWGVATYDLVGFFELRQIGTTLLNLMPTLRVILAFFWILYLLVGPEPLLFTVTIATFVIFPLHLNYAILSGTRLSGGPSLASVSIAGLAISISAPDEEIPPPSARSASNPIPTRDPIPAAHDGSSFDGETVRSGSQPLAVSRGNESSSQQRNLDSRPPFTIHRSLSNLIPQRNYCLVSIEFRTIGDVDRVLRGLEQLYAKFDTTCSFDECTKATVDFAESLHHAGKQTSLFLGVPPVEGVDDSVATAVSMAETTLRGVAAFRDLTCTSSSMYSLASRVRSGWIVQNGEGADIPQSTRGSVPQVKWVLKAASTPPSVAEALLEAKSLALLACYWLQGRRLATYYPPESTKIAWFAPVSAAMQLLWSITSPCPKPLKEAMETVWNCESAPLPPTPNHPRKMSMIHLDEGVTFTTDAVLAMMQSYRGFWETASHTNADGLPTQSLETGSLGTSEVTKQMTQIYPNSTNSGLQ